MRQILFRGKKIDNGEWTYGFYFEHSIDGQKHSYIKYQTFDEGFVTDEVDADTVGQYTGIRDDQGVKIFEGDIVNVHYNDDTSYLTEVRADGNTLCVDIDDDFDDCNFTSIDFAIDRWREDGCELRVISNIYDKDKDADAAIEFLKAENISI